MLNHPNDHVGAEVLAFLSDFMYDGNKEVQVISLHFIHLLLQSPCDY